MKKLVLLWIISLISVISFAQLPKNKQPESLSKIKDVLHPSSTAVISGYVGEKLDLSYNNRVFAQDVDRLVAPFKVRNEAVCWQTEFWGKWFTSAVLAYRYKPEPSMKAILDKAVSGLISTQTPDGYIGNYTEEKQLERWDIWGRKYCILGLMAYYDLSRDKKSLDAACKEADYLIKQLKEKNATIISKGDHRGMVASSVLEPICLLYTRTGNQKYLDFAEEIVKEWETPQGPQLISKSSLPVAKRWPVPEVWYGPLQGSKAYEMMSCYEGLAELYRITGKREYLDALENTWNSIFETELNVIGSGSGMEGWFGGKELQIYPVYQNQETCVTATWIKLCQQMLRLTGECKYADAIELAYYNALLGAMTPDASGWSYFSPILGYREIFPEQCGMGLNCCNASGPRGLFTFPLTAIMEMNEGIQINFFAEGSYSLKTPGDQNAEIKQKTGYPVDGKITFSLKLPKPEEMSIRIRIPEWSKNTALMVNGVKVDEVIPGKFTDIHRKWSSEDQINLELDMRARVLHQGEPQLFSSIMRGPIVLARDSRLPGPDINALLLPITDENGYLDLEPIEHSADGIHMQYMAKFKPESHLWENNQTIKVGLCDYASAGNKFAAEDKFRVWIPWLINPSRRK